MRLRRAAPCPIAGLVLCAVAGCSAPDECVEVDRVCDPLYQPTFDNVFDTTLQNRCGVPGVACHAPEGANGGLVFADIDDAYAQLMGRDGASARIDPGQPGCGRLLIRLHSSDAAFQMPPSAPLSDAELCAIDRWVLEGARR